MPPFKWVLLLVTSVGATFGCVVLQLIALLLGPYQRVDTIGLSFALSLLHVALQAPSLGSWHLCDSVVVSSPSPFFAC